MKLAALILIATLPTLASALPLVTKTSGGGYTPPEWSRWETCELYKDHVVITDFYGTASGAPVKMSRELKVTLDGSVETLLQAAKGESERRSENGMCDGPSTTVLAYLPSAKDERDDFNLYTTGGCGSDRIEREGAAAAALRNMIDQFCPTTFDIEQGR